MSRRPLQLPSFPLFLTLVALAACAERASPPPAADPDTAAAMVDPPVVEVMEGSGEPCTFTPSRVAVAVGNVTTIHPAGGCARVPRKAVLSWDGDGPAPAGIGPRGCAAQEGLATMVLKVARCAPGRVRLTIYADSTDATRLQEIEIVDP